MSSDKVPDAVVRTRLWQRLKDKPAHQQMLLDLRGIAEDLGRQVERTIPEFTDHSVVHMDALWRVSDQVLSELETAQMTPAEVLILGASFYVHDLGMALASTEAGILEIRSSNEYRTALARLRCAGGLDEPTNEALAIQLAAREMHPETAYDFATAPLPGLGRYLIENTELREGWSNFIGDVAASHHWDLDQVLRKLGAKGAAPMPDGDVADLVLIACILRIVDYAHINHERASSLDRALRSEISAESLVHWIAQSNITGPMREDNHLKYVSTRPIGDVDAWWLFYDLASGLDSEIRSVRESLSGRAASANRFSLQGVKGIETPEKFVLLVELTGNIKPIDIRVQPHSMERVVQLLGGPQLYGPDSLAPIRELIQNSQDAILLRNATELAEKRDVTQGHITIALEEQDKRPLLSIRDNGVGMAQRVVVRHLISVASDFWHSAEFFRDFEPAHKAGFKPVGRFGIGFLSVFMLGDEITVETEAAGQSRVSLKLRGLGHRGELRESAPTGNVGTIVRVVLKPRIAEILKNLAAVVRSRAPMTPIALEVEDRRGAQFVTERIEPGWWKHCTHSQLSEFVRDWSGIAYRGNAEDEGHYRLYYYSRLLRYRRISTMSFGGKYSLTGWPGRGPEVSTESSRVVGGGGALCFGVIFCSRGIAVNIAPIGDLTGIVDVGDVELAASRESFPDLDAPGENKSAMAGVESRVIADMRPEIVAKLDELERHGMIPARIGFLRGLAGIYGPDVLLRTSLPWVPVIMPPGNLIHHSPTQLTKLLSKHHHVVLAWGVGPASAYTTAAQLIPAAELGQTPLIVISFEEVKVGYEKLQQLKYGGCGSTIEGTLDQILEKVGSPESEMILAPILVRAVADAWSISPEAISNQIWRLEYENNILWADLSRPVTPPDAMAPSCPGT
jgi:hypothetical protein